MRAQPSLCSGQQRSRWGLAAGVCAVHAAALGLGLTWWSQTEVAVRQFSTAPTWVRLLPAAVPTRTATSTPPAQHRPVAQAHRDVPQQPAPTLPVTAVPTPTPILPAMTLAMPTPAAPETPSPAPDTQAHSALGAPAVPVAGAPAVAGALPNRAAQALPGNVMPVYPAAAREDGLEGPVSLRVQVDAQGRVREVDWLQRSGIALLDITARDAVRHWRFLPALRAGEPVAASVDVVIRFRLDSPRVQLAQASVATP